MYFFQEDFFLFSCVLAFVFHLEAFFKWLVIHSYLFFRRRAQKVDWSSAGEWGML